MSTWEKFLESINKLKKKIGNENIEQTDENGTCVMVDNDKLLLISNEKYLTLKCLEKKYNLEPYVVSNKNSEQRTELVKTYEFNHIALEKINMVSVIKSLPQVISLILKNDVKSIFSLKIDGVESGDLIYDSIIMNEHKYTVKTLRSRAALREILLMYYTYYEYKRVFDRLNPRYFIAQDLVYRDGFAARYAVKRGIKTVLLTTGRPSHVLVDSDNVKFPKIYEKDIKKCIETLPMNWLDEVNATLERLFKGEGDWNAKNAYKGKEITTAEDMLSEIGINNKKKNIFIMVHCFSDAPHGNGEQLYKDYYTWFCETLKIAAKIDSVNWLIKLHPSRYQYGEAGVAEDIVSKFSRKNIYIVPDKYSTVMVKKVADCAITVNGSAGLELPCAGIPCITGGKPFYSGFGYTITPKSINEYENILKNINTIEKMDEDMIILAKKVYYSFSEIFHVNDSFSDKCYKIHQHYCVDKNIEDANEKYMNAFIDNVNDSDCMNTYNYKYAMHI